MTDLRHERERRRLSLDDVSHRARIPRRYLAALEDNDHDVLPPGPFHRGYRQQYLDFLGISDDDTDDTQSLEATEPVTGRGTDRTEHTDPTLDTGELPTRRGPPPAVRLALAGFLVTFAAILLARLAIDLGGPGAPTGPPDSSAAATARPGTTAAAATPPEAVPAAPSEPDAAAALHDDQELRIRAPESVRVRVLADGVVVLDGRLEAGRTHEFRAAERLEADLAHLEQVQVHFNGERIVPLGNLSVPRRLVFIHDDGPPR